MVKINCLSACHAPWLFSDVCALGELVEHPYRRLVNNKSSKESPDRRFPGAVSEEGASVMESVCITLPHPLTLTHIELSLS